MLACFSVSSCGYRTIVVYNGNFNFKKVYKRLSHWGNGSSGLDIDFRTTLLGVYTVYVTSGKFVDEVYTDDNVLSFLG